MIDLSPDVVTVAITRADGGVTVMQVIESEYQMNNDKTDRVRTMHREVTSEYIDSLIEKRGEAWNEVNGKKAVSWRIVDNDYADADRTYRNAWKDTPGRDKPDHDMVKARNIHRDHLRNSRIKIMDDLDIQYQKADERNDQASKRNVAAQKQKLRDVTEDSRIEQAQTVEELKILTIEELTK